MTERKPREASWRSWIEHQIEEGHKSGAFDDLEGHGQPIRDLDRPHDDLWWVKAKLEREEVVVTPPSLAIRVERDAVLDAIGATDSEAEVRTMIAALNDKIRELNRTVTWGPPTSLAPLDVDEVVERWRVDRQVRPAPEAHEQPSSGPSEVPAPQRRRYPWPLRRRSDPRSESRRQTP